VALRITHLAYSLDKEMVADEVDEAVDLNTTISWFPWHYNLYSLWLYDQLIKRAFKDIIQCLSMLCIPS
jgi:hypothetical protein